MDMGRIGLPRTVKLSDRRRNNMPRHVCNRCRCKPCACDPRGKRASGSLERDGSADTFEMVASYADGRHYAETTDAVLDAMLAAKEHLDKEGCDYVRIMRQREYPPNVRVSDDAT